MKNIKNEINKKEEIRIFNKKEGTKFIDYDAIKSIAYKALKVAACNNRGVNMQALIIAERYMNAKNDDWNDACQDVALACLENGYKMNDKLYIKRHSFILKNKVNKFDFISKISKKTIYRSINKLLNIALHTQKNISIDTYVNDNLEMIERVSYSEFVANLDNEYNSENIAKKTSINLNSLGLTQRQVEILQIYAKTNSLHQTAEILGVSYGFIRKTVNIIRNKISNKIAI